MNGNPVIPQWNARQVILATCTAVAVGIGFWLLFRYRMVVLILFTAIILGTAIRPLVDWFSRRGLGRVYALTTVYVLLLSAGAVVLVSLVPVLTSQTLNLSVTIPEIYLDLRATLQDSSSMFLRNLAYNLPVDFRLLFSSAPAETEALDAVLNLNRFAGIFLNGFLTVVGVFLLTSFWILESDRALRGVLLYAPAQMRQPVREIIQAVEVQMGAFVRGQLILSLSIGILALIAYLLIGLPNALVLALIAGICETIPIFGPALGAVPALLVAFSTEPSLVGWVILATILMQILENYFLVPRVMGASVGVNPIVTLLTLATLASILGAPGALLAIPLAAVVQLLLDRSVFSKEQTGPTNLDGRDYNSALRYEIQDLISDVRRQLRSKRRRSHDETDQIEDSIEALAFDLDVLLARSIEVEENT
jgi:predicted PurR-regulated permease PerM